jgi:hypothetical protein
VLKSATGGMVVLLRGFFSLVALSPYDYCC